MQPCLCLCIFQQAAGVSTQRGQDGQECFGADAQRPWHAGFKHSNLPSLRLPGLLQSPSQPTRGRRGHSMWILWRCFRRGCGLSPSGLSLIKLFIQLFWHVFFFLEYVAVQFKLHIIWNMSSVDIPTLWPDQPACKDDFWIPDHEFWILNKKESFVWLIASLISGVSPLST